MLLNCRVGEDSSESLGTARRSNQSILKEISLEYSLEGLMLNLKLQYFGHLMQVSWLIWKDPNAGKDWRQEEKGPTEDETVGWHHQLKWTWVWASSGRWWWTVKLGVLHSTGSQRVRHNWATELILTYWNWKCGIHIYDPQCYFYIG